MFQVPHAKGKISQLYNLHVLVPTAYILGSDEYHVGVGSAINLVCIIENVSINEYQLIDCEETKGRNPQNPNFLGSPKN